MNPPRKLGRGGGDCFLGRESGGVGICDLVWMSGVGVGK